MIFSNTGENIPMLLLTIITTVYDRIECLKNCINSVRALTFKNYEHLIASDHPSEGVIDKIQALVSSYNDPRISYHDIPERHNNGGQAPGESALKKATGKYVAFLSDDNGYLPKRFEPLIALMEADESLAFVYTSCYYMHFGGILNFPVPAGGRVDMGQPLFRRSLFSNLNDSLPFFGASGDWGLIRTFMTYGTWRFVDDPTFVFRLKDFPQFIA